MPWVKFSDDWYDDYELVEAGPAAMLLWTTGISWCARNLSDGRIPASQIPRLVDWQAIGTTAEQVVAPLVANGRLQAIEGGFLFTNYLNYQPSREQVVAEREAAKARAAKSRGSSAHVQRTNGRSAPPPVPVPDTPPPPSTSDARGLPADLWMKVASKRLAATKARGITVASDAAWKKKAAENARTELEERAVELVRGHQLTMSQLVDALLSETNPSWLSGLRRGALGTREMSR